MHRFFYEAKPYVLISVGILSLIQQKGPPLVFTISGCALIGAGSMILILRQKYRKQRQAAVNQTAANQTTTNPQSSKPEQPSEK